MKPNRSFTKRNRTTVSALVFCLLASFVATAQNAAPEKKVDYLERIYFSGENKEGLNTKILIALQEIKGKPPTDALAQQLTYLVEIQEKAEAAADACEVLDILAAGIYNIDAAEANNQGVKPASDKAKKASVDALGAVNKLTSMSTSVGDKASTLGWQSFFLSGGKTGAFLSGTSKLANTAGKIGAIGGAIGGMGETAKQLGDIGKSLGINPFKKKDKPCKDVAKKEIAIGDHTPAGALPNAADKTGKTPPPPLPANTTTTVISIQGVASPALRTLTDELKNKEGVQSVEKAFAEKASTITVVHAGSTSDLADWMEEKCGAKLKMVNYETGKINMAAKPAK